MELDWCQMTIVSVMHCVLDLNFAAILMRVSLRMKCPPCGLPQDMLYCDLGRRLYCVYSPNRRRTRLSTLSFSGSYGWSLLGISRTVGKAAVCVSIRCRILSAILNMG